MYYAIAVINMQPSGKRLHGWGRTVKRKTRLLLCQRRVSDSGWMESAAAAFQTASLQETFIMPHYQMGFQLTEGVNRDSDNNQQTGSAEE